MADLKDRATWDGVYCNVKRKQTFFEEFPSLW